MVLCLSGMARLEAEGGGGRGGLARASYEGVMRHIKERERLVPVG